ncbi:MAG: hypothetical protein JST00_17405 [Deltaproteobacteria bacterium]|nr:hypothetical protein [Deltaproteobacteria bacterium]
MSSQPPTDERSSTAGAAAKAPRRPRYLVAALLMALLFGAGCWTEGCERISFYRGEQDLGRTLDASIRDDADRAKIGALYKRFAEASDAARSRALPLGAAMFVLGAALLALGARGLGGKTNTRSALVQVVTAQAVVVAISYFATREIRWAERDLEVELQLIHQRPSLPADQYEQLVPMMYGLRKAWDPTWLVIRTMASGLIVFALTRARSREFFEAASGSAVSER